MSYIWSAKNNSFYPTGFISNYEGTGIEVDDGVEVDESFFQEFTAAPAGKVRGIGDDGMPKWIDAPPPTQEEEIAAAEQKKAALLSDAQSTISLWQMELQLNLISDDDKASLISWLSYIKEIQAVDTSSAPDISWPVPPEE